MTSSDKDIPITPDHNPHNQDHAEGIGYCKDYQSLTFKFISPLEYLHQGSKEKEKACKEDRRQRSLIEHHPNGNRSRNHYGDITK
jgi:hypothetical protein